MVIASWKTWLLTAALQIVCISFNPLAAAGPSLENKLLAPGAEERDLPLVEITTTQGIFTVELLTYAAPKACENFMTLVERGYYNGLLFHRIIPGFMIQGGDPTGTGRGGSSIWNRPFADEFLSGLNFTQPGILAMANSGPSTNGSQFFITVDPTPWLNRKHTIFGLVIDGYDVVLKISKMGTQSGRPISPQKIISAKVSYKPAVINQ